MRPESTSSCYFIISSAYFPPIYVQNWAGQIDKLSERKNLLKLTEKSLITWIKDKTMLITCDILHTLSEEKAQKGAKDTNIYL